MNPICDKQSGQCPCQPRVTGLTCKEPLKAHYFPTLHQYQYEAEDGRTPSGSAVRYDFAEDLFPDFSWKGYAVFDSTLQNKIVLGVDISKSSLYRMVLRYVNPNNEPILGTITIIPDNPSEVEQVFKVNFKPSTKRPSFVTVAGAHGNHPSPMVMNPGHWSINIATEKSLFLDYFVLLPSEYYEGGILTQDVNVPCEIGYKGLCRHYGYPNLTRFDSVHGDGGFLNENNARIPLSEYFTDRETLQEIGEDEIPLINTHQEEIHFDLRISKPGPHVLVVTYITPKEETMSVLLIEANTVGKGKVTLNPCRYTSLCRQVVTDTYGKVAVMNFLSNYVSLVLTGEPTTNVAIDSIVAIPYHEWSLDYVKPKSVCVRKDGKCVQGLFPGAADAKKIEFETSSGVSESEYRPLGIYDNATKLIYLKDGDTMVDIHAKVSQPGDYVFVVQYYQPDYPEFELDVLVQNGKFYEAKIPVSHCPSNSGCRSIVRQIDGGSTIFQLIENFMLTLKEPSDGRGIWLDYVLVIPADLYNEKILSKMQFDQTKEFIKRCGNNHFRINITEDGFCRDSSFSLTTNYNNGALPCNCDVEGSTSFECDKFGGQCPCRPNIIGRRCEICKTGFYGFPRCRPCNCPALCEPDTGRCICPPRVTGEQCDQCEVGTYGFHQIIGCEECNCSPLGVINGDLQCHLQDGSCRCKENVVGRQCDRCRAGYSQFPHCERCDCDLRGTTGEICDQYTAECFCKANVQGQACDVCREGTFDIQAANEDGCTKCFCFGKTTRCASANLYWTYLIDMAGWEVVMPIDKSGNFTPLSIYPIGNNTATEINLITDDENVNSLVYFSAPDAYLGKKLTSYGGHFNFTIHYITGPFGKAISAADVVLQGADTTLFYYSDEQPPSFVNYGLSVRLVETNFLTSNRLSATREQIMVVLEDLRGIYVRATYWDPTFRASLSYATLDVTTEQYSAQYSIPASSVEQCQCPPNYQGLSCEECAPGYYRVQSGPYGGYCAPCQCNGHASTCDVNTGICEDCKNGTTGDHCEYCEQGYYGNATIGTPTDCLICACPLPIASNNFATGCEVNEEGNKISCDCLPGYYGARCEACAAGYYGTPEVYGEYCKPCECSGNIDTNQIGSCDSITGECLQCLNNTYGEACNLCAPGYFGDAVERKDCRSCMCDDCGMEHCDSYSGQCFCQENVIGEQCDRCEPDHYGFNSCEGCKPCDCGLASENSQCDDETGQCKCMPGVTGRRCDQCIPGYWDYGPDGCTSCECHTGYSVGVSCNTTTGQCTCLPGVIGEKCDHCPYRHVLIPAQGCFACDSCTGNLLDVTDDIAHSLEPVLSEYSTVAESYFTNQRLKFINDLVNELYPKVQLLDPNRVNLLPLQEKLERLNYEVDSQKRRIDFTSEDSVKTRDNAENTLQNMINLEEDVINEINLVNLIVSEVQSLAQNIELGTGAKIENSLKEAKEILKRIKDVSFIDFRDKAVDQADQANILVSEMQEYNFPVSNLSLATAQLSDKIKNASVKMDDMLDLAQKAQEVAGTVDRLNRENRIAAQTGNLDIVKNSTAEAKEDLNVGEELNKNASQFLENAKANIATLQDNISNGTFAQQTLNNTIAQNDQMLINLYDPVQKAHNHAAYLYNRSLELDSLLTDTRNTNAVRAVSAYRDIEAAIQAAMNATEHAIIAADNATALSDGIEQKLSDFQEECVELLRAAQLTLGKTTGQPENDLRDARINATLIDNQNKRNKETLDTIDKILANIPSQSSSSVAHDAMNQAINVERNIKTAIDDLNGIVDQIPADLQETRQLSKNTSESIRDISQANKQLDIVDKILPNITSLLNNLNNNQKSIDATGNDLQSKLEALRNKIANARELANRFKTGLTFYRNTTLELKNPESLPLLATSTKISLYFRTNKTNGFLLYLGNEEKMKLPRSKTHDFMALLIESGYPVLIVDLGSGPEKIIHDKFVSDNVWRQIIIDRTGKNVKLIVREDIGDGQHKLYEKERVLSGTYYIFNVDPDYTKLFVGGYPSSFHIQDAVTASSFEGEMEELVIGDIPVSFWNFVDGENNWKSALERDKLINFAPSTGYRFDRNGYAILNKKDSQILADTKKFSIKLSFKTFADDGLIYLMGKNKQFLSLELRNGQLLYQFDLGEGKIALRSSDKYNDGTWHVVEALRQERKGLLKVDGHIVASKEGEGTAKTLASSDYIYFGGYPPNVKHPYQSVSNSGFEGCIDNVIIRDTSIDLTHNVQAFGVMPGCPVRFASLVSFEKNLPGYVRWRNWEENLPYLVNELQVNLKFKTSASDGLIFYATNDDQPSPSITYLSLVDGQLVFNSQGKELTTSPTDVKFNDDEWHVVTATHNQSVLSLDIDDAKSYSIDSASPLHFLQGNLYIGGLPSSLDPDNRFVPFVGCIGDATLNGRIIINFANTSHDERPHAFLEKCKRGDHIQPSEPEVLIPLIPSEIPDDSSVEMTTQISVVNVTSDEEEIDDKGPPLEGRIHTSKKYDITTITTQSPTQQPQTVDDCHLPYYPATDPNLENAYRFGTARNSRLEYRTVKGRYKDDYDFQIDIQTAEDEGIIFYTSDLNKQDLIAVYVLNGTIHYKFDCGSGPALLVSDKKINDNQWHIITFKRQGNYGELIVDDENPVTDYSQGDETTIDVNPPFFVGGVLPELSDILDTDVVRLKIFNFFFYTAQLDVQNYETHLCILFQGFNKTFSGCLGNLMINGQLVGEPSEKIGVISCSKKVEPGLFFFPSSGNVSNVFKPGKKVISKNIFVLKKIYVKQ